MAKRTRKKKKKFNYSLEVWAVVFILLSVLGIGLGKPVGLLGRIVQIIAVFFFGKWNVIFMLMFLALGIYILLKRDLPSFFNKKLIGIYFFLIALLILAHLPYIELNNNISGVLQKSFSDIKEININLMKSKPYDLIGGGILGALLVALLNFLIDFTATKILAFIMMIAGISIFTSFSAFEYLKPAYFKFKTLIEKSKTEEDETAEKSLIKEDEKEPIKTYEELEELCRIKDEKDVAFADKEVGLDGKGKSKSAYKYQLPPLSLLNDPVKQNSEAAINVEKYSKILEDVLKEFGIIGTVVNYYIGPSVTQYELELKSGVKLSKLVGLNKEISLALAKRDVRIQAPIPGKSTVGIEVANDSISPVSLKEVLIDEPRKAKSKKLHVALGKNIMGESRFTEIDKTPHLLVAGATGSGKSVCINSIIASLLMRTTPDEVKLVMVDPKKVELSLYNGIPHLLMPVVTDPRKASVALQKIVGEMERRYVDFSDKNVKNIVGYNELIAKENKKRSKDDQIEKMYYIVVIVDELADLMLVASREVEDSIMRITQMARAAGIHLIVATQRPSTDVITGLVKSNIPSRLSFAVSSSIDSRTILDMGGAEKLLGKGDMLYFPMGASAPERIQGTFVSDEELQRLVAHTVKQQKASYDDDFMNLNEAVSQGNAGGVVSSPEEEYEDPLYNEIVDFIIDAQKASASSLQRRFKIGYNRAARVMDLLEERGIVGPMQGSKPREVLIDKDND